MKSKCHLSGKKAQTWSADLLLAFSVFLITMAVFLYVLNLSKESTAQTKMKQEVSLLPNYFVMGRAPDSKLAFIEGNRVLPDKLSDVANMSYSQLKSLLGIKYDFCIYFEDEQGNLINLSRFLDIPVVGIGSPQARVNNMACGKT